MSENVDTQQTQKLMKMDYSYPDPADPELQKKIYEKREFHYHIAPERQPIESYSDIKEYRENICARNFTLHEHQAMLSNFINPNTPYKGLLVFHGMGSGKCQSKDVRVYINGSSKKMDMIWNDNKTKIISRYMLLKLTFKFNNNKTKEEDFHGWH